LSYVDYDGFKKKKKHLSKREQRARSLGLNPDKDKYKVGKMSHKEYKRALKAHREAEKKKTIAKYTTSKPIRGQIGDSSSMEASISAIFTSSTANSLQNTLSNLDQFGYKIEFTNDKAKLCNKKSASGCFYPTSRTMYLSTAINSNSVLRELTFAHEAQHALDTFDRSETLNTYDRIVLEVRARVTATKVWEELGKPKVESGKEWTLRHPVITGLLQVASDSLDDLEDKF